ncbi:MULTISPECIES: flagellar hook-associated protein FlgL [Clostridium]|uniref:flagellar hook-associated protein FlgL n=1 Tax=Clostridium TaxID=1485 RepID=UPI000824D061|nr:MULTISPECIES: flagellar hook-associated protein FlgL [Clostridium]PJI09822.1 flagellar hook-associated protein 3 [Clostridium sp. CT7]
MRITNSMLSDNFLMYLSNNLQNVQKYQQQMSTGEKISLPSDDPYGTTQVMQINEELSENAQYASNINDAKNWSSVTDTDLGQVQSVLQRINELLYSAGDAAYGSQQLTSIKNEINANIGQLAQCMNSNYDGRYIFGGTRATFKPVGTTTDSDGNTQLDYIMRDGTAINRSSPSASETTQLNQINSRLSTEISAGVSVSYNIQASSVIQFNNTDGNSKDLRTILSNIVKDLSYPNSTGNHADGDTTTTGRSFLIGSDLSDIQDAINNVSKVRTEIGAVENRMTTAASVNDSENTNLTELLSSVNDADYAETTMKYSETQATYSASLYVSAKVLQETLLDYVK